ncbi:hypothetical protein J3459_007751 [Metarhizium acridum]|nr:hypothetical protein J3459_007751 [Metarhizium acridum]
MDDGSSSAYIGYMRRRTNIYLLCLANALETGTYGTGNQNHTDVFLYQADYNSCLLFIYFLRGGGLSFLFLLFSPLVDLETGYGHGAATRFLSVPGNHSTRRVIVQVLVTRF